MAMSSQESVRLTGIIRGQKVQVSSALLESQRAEAREVVDSKGNTKTVYQESKGRWFKETTI